MTSEFHEFLRKYAYHTRRCRYPHLTCDCGYTRARATVDTVRDEQDMEIRRLRKDVATLQRDYERVTYRRHRTDKEIERQP